MSCPRARCSASHPLLGAAFTPGARWISCTSPSSAGTPVSPAGLCPLQVAWLGAGMSFPPCPAPCCILDRQRPFPFLLHLLPLLRALRVPRQRKRLRYSDLDFEVSPATAAGVTGTRHGVGCRLVTEPPCPWFPLARCQQSSSRAWRSFIPGNNERWLVIKTPAPSRSVTAGSAAHLHQIGRAHV